MLVTTVVLYAFFTFLSGFADNFREVFIGRALQGLAFGGGWTAGAVLLGEIMRGKYRVHVVGFVQRGWAIGWGRTAIVYTLLFSALREGLACRVMFWKLSPV